MYRFIGPYHLSSRLFLSMEAWSLMVGSYLFIDEPKVWSWEYQRWTDSGDNDRSEGIGNTNGESHEAPLLAPPLPSPPTMTHAEMMAEMLAARCESAYALEMLAQAIGGFACGGHGGNGGNGGGSRGPKGPVLTRIS